MKSPAAPITIVVGAVFGLSALALDAATAHEAQTLVPETRWHAFSVGLRVQQWHATVLLVTGVLLLHRDLRLWRAAAVLFSIGIVAFSGSLFVGALLDDPPAGIGSLTPIGGVALMLGWLLLSLGGWFVRRQ